MSHRSRALRLSAALASALFTCRALADITYKVVPNPDKQTLSVEMSLSRTKFNTDFQMPNWAPGAYIVANFWKGVRDLHIFDDEGHEVTVTKLNDYTWRVSSATGEKLTAKYEVSCSYSDGSMHYSGPATYLYVVDRKTEPCTLDLETPPSWRIAIGLEHARRSEHRFRAKDYDVLADNPVTMGDFVEQHYTVAGKDHTVALRGAAKADVDMNRLIKAASFVNAMETDFFGGAPYDKYVWHFSISDSADGGGGLEHLSSTQIGLSSGVGPRCVNVMSHEAFHAWNVKRIRSSVLGPFDYTQLPQTGALWWLEGVTDYYAYLLLHRYGWRSDGEYFQDIVHNVDALRANLHRFEISPYQSSYRVREANNGVGNSNGLLVSYYDTGWILGLCLDIEIRSRTKGRYSLDDVEYALWKECRNDSPGFQEDEIRNLCVKFGGPTLGDFYDKYVMEPGELPVETQLAKVGLQWSEQERTLPTFGFTYQGSHTSGGAKVGSVTDKGSPLVSGDVITEIGGKPMTGLTAGQVQQTMTTAEQESTPGKLIHVKVNRKTGPDSISIVEADISPTTLAKTIHVIQIDTGASADKLKLRDGWFWSNRRRPFSTTPLRR